MPWLGIDRKGAELIYERDHSRNDGTHFCFIELPVGTIERLIGRKLKKGEAPFPFPREGKAKNEETKLPHGKRNRNK